ncbi:MAG TPA: sigma-70 family RNA polymerase sigma factor [Kofleriaceae bacterium]|nr:sigma-70 family RNA polymerase sigma factor [Kofleriaceae bacterium]
MTEPERQALEAEVRARCERADHAGAAAAIVRGYGPELVRFLASLLRSSDDDLAEVFSIFCEDVVRGLPGFRFASTIRTWSYTVARHAAARFRRSGRRRGKRYLLPGELQDVAEQVRSATVDYLRDEVKTKLAVAREKLSDDERTIIMLRVDRQLGWREIAEIMADETLSADELRKRDQALRKRFEVIKARLRDHMGA